MRTTIAIGDRLLESARREARRRGLTLGRLVEEALRRELAACQIHRALAIFPTIEHAREAFPVE